MDQNKSVDRINQSNETRFRTIFEGAGIGIAVIEITSGRYCEVNPAFLKMLGYTQDELCSYHYHEITHPADLEIELPFYQEVVRGKNDGFQMDKRYRCKDGSYLWTHLIVSVIREEQDYVIGMIENISAPKQAEEQILLYMEENIKRTQELESIVQVSAGLRRTKKQDEMVAIILQESAEILEADVAALAILNGNLLVFQSATRDIQAWEGFELTEQDNIFWECLREGTVVIREANSDQPLIARLASIAHSCVDIHLGACAPLKSGAATIGVLFLGYTSPENFTNTHRRLLLAIADIAGNALHRVRTTEAMESLVAHRSHELETIYRVTAAASEETSLSTALHDALELILEAVSAQIGAIVLTNEPTEQCTVIAGKGLLPEVKNEIEQNWGENRPEKWILEHKKPLVLSNLAADLRVNKNGKPPAILPFAGLPMRVDNRIVGILEVARIDGNPIDSDELTLLTFISDHLGLVIENALLRERAEQNAVNGERARLARELHDSVIQSLYSASLMAMGGRRLIARGEIDRLEDYLCQLGNSTQQALKEMRLLVYELHPPELRINGLAKVIQHRLEAVEGRVGIHTSLDIKTLPVLPQLLEEELVRIIFEGLNNAIKHSSSKEIRVSIWSEMETIHAVVEDRGTGFDLSQVTESGGLGLISMRERAERLNGSLQIETCPGVGTTIRTQIPLIDPYKPLFTGRGNVTN